MTSVAAVGAYYLLREIAFSWMLLAEAAFLAVSLLALRVCGYRLARLGKRHPDLERSEQDTC
jgi:hypothetical protein